MINRIAMLLSLVCLASCTAYIKESSFIAQDKQVISYQQQELAQLMTEFPNHNVKNLALITEDKSATLRGLLLDNPASNDVIYFIPGNGMKVSTTAKRAFTRLVDLEKDIVYFDRRGLGASDGKANIANLISDAIETLHFIRSELQPETLIVHGFSLGSFVAGQLAKSEHMDALVLEGTATNVGDWIDQSTPWYTKPFLTIEVDEVFSTVDNREVVSEYYAGPLLIIGGEKDEQVPVELSTSLFQASKSTNKKLMIVERADHGSMLDQPNEKKAYKSFLNSIQPN
jgi:uncharacterized protein